MPKRNPTCGCGPCLKSTNCHECCRCLPDRICVILDPTESIGCSCGPREFALQWNGEGWSGILVCGDLTIDVAFTIEKEGADCFFFFESSCLGFTGENRRKMEFPPVPGFNCLDWSFVFEFDASGCGDPNCDIVTISVAPVELVLNPQSDKCGGCRDCRCLPKRLCIELDVDNPDAQSFGTVEWDEDQELYQGTVFQWGLYGEVAGDPIHVTITVIKDEYGFCVFNIATSGGLVFSGDPIVPEDGDCPYDLNLTWTTPDGRVINATSELCGVCGGEPCCPEPIPLTIYMKLTDLAGCLCADDAYGDGYYLYEMDFDGSGQWNIASQVRECTGVPDSCEHVPPPTGPLINNIVSDYDCPRWSFHIEFDACCESEGESYVEPNDALFVIEGCLPLSTVAVLSAGDECCDHVNYGFLVELQAEPFE